MKTPGVYVLEKDAFPHSVVQVDTAVPVFVGYTEKAVDGRNKPVRITSVAEYIRHFGGAPDYKFQIQPQTSSSKDLHDFEVGGTPYTVEREGASFILYNAVRLFYQNGGGVCYIISVGAYILYTRPLKDIKEEIDKKVLKNANDVKNSADTIKSTADGIKTESVTDKATASTFLTNTEAGSVSKIMKDVQSSVDNALRAWPDTDVIDAARKIALEKSGIKESDKKAISDNWDKIKIDARTKAKADAQAKITAATQTIADAKQKITAITETDASKQLEAAKPQIERVVAAVKEAATAAVAMAKTIVEAVTVAQQLVAAALAVKKEITFPEIIDSEKLQGALDMLKKEPEPTLVVIPELMSLETKDIYSIQGKILDHCGALQNRFAILDVYQDKDKTKTVEQNAEAFRNAVTSKYLMWGAAYYPWLSTSIVQTSELSFLNISNLGELDGILDKDPDKKGDKGIITAWEQEITKATEATLPAVMAKATELHKKLFSICPAYKSLLSVMQQKLNLLPPSAAIAGIYAQLDHNRGVWKAPANVALGATVSPAVNVSSEEQEDLNSPLDGKAINAIRVFPGEGPIVWGARTLDGNSQDWRYVNVRRTAIMIEQSVKAAAKAYVFEPNDANTWIMVKSMIDNFLHGLWRQGGLAGAKPEDAFQVQVGLGQTMTSVDILNGIFRVTVLVALSHPAEFIEITFEQQMQKS